MALLTWEKIWLGSLFLQIAHVFAFDRRLRANPVFDDEPCASYDNELSIHPQVQFMRVPKTVYIEHFTVCE